MLTSAILAYIDMAKEHQYYQVPLNKEEEVKYLLEPVIAELNSRSCFEGRESERKTRVVFSVQTVEPVLQRGPMCGIVALTMANGMINTALNSTSDTLPRENAHPESILEFARRAGYTKQGEMFSVQYMKQIGQEHLSFKTETVLTESLSSSILLELLISPNKVVLVPYDADKNHSPCLANGHNAHWCVLVGFALCLENDDIDLLKFCTLSHGHFSLREDSKKQFLSEFSSNKWPVNGLHVFTRHGKSRHMGLWSWDQLKRSNGNLVEAAPQRTGPGEYVIPPGGVREGLCSQAVILSTEE